MGAHAKKPCSICGRPIGVGVLVRHEVACLATIRHLLLGHESDMQTVCGLHVERWQIVSRRANVTCKRCLRAHLQPVAMFPLVYLPAVPIASNVEAGTDPANADTTDIAATEQETVDAAPSPPPSVRPEAPLQAAPEPRSAPGEALPPEREADASEPPRVAGEVGQEAGHTSADAAALVAHIQENISRMQEAADARAKDVLDAQVLALEADREAHPDAPHPDEEVRNRSAYVFRRLRANFGFENLPWHHSTIYWWAASTAAGADWVAAEVDYWDGRLARFDAAVRSTRARLARNEEIDEDD